MAAKPIVSWLLTSIFGARFGSRGQRLRRERRLLFLSTDYVFDGRKTTPYEIDDPLSPQNVYGQSKAEAELGIREILPESCILRTSWVFGAGGKCFPETILKLAATRPVTRGCRWISEGAQLIQSDLARTIAGLCRKGAKGTVHATNRGRMQLVRFRDGDRAVEPACPAIVRPTTSDNSCGLRSGRHTPFCPLPAWRNMASRCQRGKMLWQRYLRERKRLHNDRCNRRNQAGQFRKVRSRPDNGQ